MNKKLILGSQSPRRREILGYFSVPFEVASPNFDEDSVIFNNNPHDYVCQLSSGKAASLAAKYPDDIILTADTIVYCHGKIYTKPKDSEDAFRILCDLAGNWQSVFTGLTVRCGDEEYSDSEETKVLFHSPSPDKLRLYHQQLHCDDKAGGYAVQQSGSIIVKKIDGCFYNVMGMPINTTQKLLAIMGIDLWDYLA
ncbi:MAG: Maf family protein [Chlamydiota bacterium]